MSLVLEQELLQEIPGYKAILKSVIKTQIQLLVEQLSEQTGEESIILTASVNEGTLTHHGSSMGKGFFEGRDEIKSQFLGYCLKNQQKKNIPQPGMSFQEESSSDRFQAGPSLKRQKVQSVSLMDHDDGNFHPDQAPQGILGSTTEIHKSYVSRPPAPKARTKSSSPAHRSPGVQNSLAGVKIVKTETDIDNQDNSSSFSNLQDPSGVPAFQQPDLPPSVHLTHTQTESPAISSSRTESVDSELSEMTHSGDSSQESSIKVEPVTESELELEITGVEMGSGATGFQESWSQDTSGNMGYPPSGSGESSLDQSGNHYSLLPAEVESVTGQHRYADLTEPSLLNHTTTILFVVAHVVVVLMEVL